MLPIARIVVVRIFIKIINLWMRLLEMKRKEMQELAGLMRLEGVEEEIEKRRVWKCGQRDAPLASLRK